MKNNLGIIIFFSVAVITLAVLTYNHYGVVDHVVDGDISEDTAKHN
jgi:hypothetical protein